MPNETVPILALALDSASSTPLYQQLYEAIRRLILSGQLPAGARIPSSRMLAKELGISRTTVRIAYEQLSAEGYLVGTAGSGTRVSAAIPDQKLQSPQVRSCRQKKVPAKLSLRGNDLLRRTEGKLLRDRLGEAFELGRPAADEFPFRIWNRLQSRHRRHAGRELLGYGEAAGYRPLREAIAEYLHTARSVNCTPEQVVVVAHWQRGVQMISMCLLDPGDAVWVESPGFASVEHSLLGVGASIVSVSVDGEGLSVKAGVKECRDARLAFVTPSYQYPYGVTMSLARRFELLEWASSSDAWVLEDDFNCEYRYAGRPIPSLQGLDTGGRVIYIGTFSSVLFPAIQLSFLVVPAQLVNPFMKILRLIGHHTVSVDQAVLADFIREGHFAAHLRRMRKIYAARQETLVRSVKRHLGGWIEMGPADAGMHLIGWLPEEVNDVSAAEIAARGGIQLTPLSNYYIHRPMRSGLLFGYTSLSERQIQDGVRRLADALGKYGRELINTDGKRRLARRIGLQFE